MCIGLVVVRRMTRKKIHRTDIQLHKRQSPKYDPSLTKPHWHVAKKAEVRCMGEERTTINFVASIGRCMGSCGQRRENSLDYKWEFEL